MQRDKRGRFIKKAQDGLKLEGTVIGKNGGQYQIKKGAYQAFLNSGATGTFENWLMSEQGDSQLILATAPVDLIPRTPGISTPTPSVTQTPNIILETGTDPDMIPG